MANKARNTSGKFAPKSDTPRKIRSVNLTDRAWQWLADVAVQSGVSRNDYLEAMAEGGIPFMETVNSEIEVDSANTVQQLDIEIYPLMETVEVASESQDEEDIRAEYNALLESSTHITNKLRDDVAKLRSQLETERADREEVEAQLFGLEQKSVTAKDFDVAGLLNQLKVKRKKSSTTFADVKLLLELLDKS